MKRAQSIRNYGRPSLAIGADDLGILRGANETNEDVLKRQLIERDREVDRLQALVDNLQAQLAQRPPLETVMGMEAERKNVEFILQGMQRENERSMAEIERGKAREQLLERELSKLVGENWQETLELSPSGSPSNNTSKPITSLHQRSKTLASTPSPVLSHAHAPAAAAPHVNPQATLAHIEQVRMLVMGMEKRLQTRENKLVKSVERAESEGRRFEQLRKDVAAS